MHVTQFQSRLPVSVITLVAFTSLIGRVISLFDLIRHDVAAVSRGVVVILEELPIP